MRLVFFGTGSFAVPALRAMAEHTVLAVTQPDAPSGRGNRLTPSAVKLAALELGIPVETPERARAKEFVDRIAAMEADALLVASYGQILSERLLNSATRGGINLHGSILPRWRGAAPIQRSVEAGDPETGITLMQMDRGMDTGDIIHIERTPIGPEETYGELQDRLALLAAEMAVDWMPRIVGDNYPRIPQPEEGVTLAPKIEKAEAELRFDGESGVEHDRFRAFYPNPGPFLRTTNGQWKLHAVRLADGNGAPGEILALNPLTVAFGTGALALEEVQPEGKKRMSGRDVANGARLKPGSRLI
ncbi:methionyl-tRNA formyltransferase [bacterium]|nr:MAG: methionyl-tRNA formyltransferase [bacterium]